MYSNKLRTIAIKFRLDSSRSRFGIYARYWHTVYIIRCQDINSFFLLFFFRSKKEREASKLVYHKRKSE